MDILGPRGLRDETHRRGRYAEIMQRRRIDVRRRRVRRGQRDGFEEDRELVRKVRRRPVLERLDLEHGRQDVRQGPGADEFGDVASAVTTQHGHGEVANHLLKLGASSLNPTPRVSDLEVLELVERDDGVALCDFQVEQLLELPEVHDVVLLGVRPSEQRRKVDQRLGKDALVPETGNVRVEVAFAELLLVLVDQQRHVGVEGRRPAQGIVQSDVQRRAGHPLAPAHDVGDAHVVVVADVGPVVRRVAVGLDQDHVFVHGFIHQELLRLLRTVSALPVHQVIVPWPGVRGAKADCVLLALGGSLFGFSVGNVRAFPIVAQTQSLLVPAPVQVVKSFGCTEAPVGVARGQKRRDVLLIQR